MSEGLNEDFFQKNESRLHFLKTCSKIFRWILVIGVIGFILYIFVFF